MFGPLKSLILVLRSDAPLKITLVTGGVSKNLWSLHWVGWDAHGGWMGGSPGDGLERRIVDEKMGIADFNMRKIMIF